MIFGKDTGAYRRVPCRSPGIRRIRSHSRLDGRRPEWRHGRAAPARSILMRLPAALCSQCHGAQPTTPGAFAKAVFVAITCVEAIILCRLR